MEGQIRDIFCKYCGQRCVKKTSCTVDNPGQICWACLKEWGGHGWMKWFDNSVSPQAKEKRGRGDKWLCLERMVQVLEDDIMQLNSEKDRLVDENHVLKQECLKMEMSSLKICLKGLVVVLFLAALLFMFNCGCSEEFDSLVFIWLYDV
ncbi:hypothetical protein LIER_19509 [Lithospermum erythrorhizon]|uniref:Uncharacterized protein n=1 Tax=Lithospermum erythrorhizon TaxID=34254 RepID=A0AAV3QL10_LITER